MVVCNGKGHIYHDNPHTHRRGYVKGALWQGVGHICQPAMAPCTVHLLGEQKTKKKSCRTATIFTRQWRTCYQGDAAEPLNNKQRRVHLMLCSGVVKLSQPTYLIFSENATWGYALMIFRPRFESRWYDHPRAHTSLSLWRQHEGSVECIRRWSTL